MKSLLVAAGAALSVAAGSAHAADVGISINVAQPGFYGQINLGDVPAPPTLIFPQPVVIAPEPAYVGGPIYLHVPPGYERHWGRHCAEYRACGRPVYFVRDDWYRREYAPRMHHHDRDEGDYRGGDEHGGHDRGHEHDRGRGHGHGSDEHGRDGD